MNRTQRRLHLMIWICAAAAMAALVLLGLEAKQTTESSRIAAAQRMEPR